MLSQHDSVEVELRPRFPLFGGWQTRYYLGYNVPAYQYLYNKGDKYILKMRVIDHVFDEFVVDKLVVKIVLPEGSIGIKVKTPFKLTEGRQEIHKTYLDTVGRPVVVLSKDNLVEGHIQDLEVCSYIVYLFYSCSINRIRNYAYTHAYIHMLISDTR